MTHVSYTELRANLSTFMDQVCKNRDPLLVTRQKGPSVVLVAQEDYAGLMETVHLLRSPKNAARLLASIQAIDAGDVARHDLIEAAR